MTNEITISKENRPAVYAETYPTDYVPARSYQPDDVRTGKFVDEVIAAAKDDRIHYQNGLNNETLNELVNKVKDLNREISLDKSLGKGFCIGHSYFCGRDVCTEEWLHSIVDYDILPMLSEYWFDDANKLQRWENILQGVFQ